MNKWNTERMCRLNGQQPTVREKWTAFYRLYRISQGHGAYSDMDASDCFRILFADWRPLHLIEANESLVSRNHAPVFLRKMLLKADRRKRLYGGNHEWEERDKVVASKLRDDGVEVTPEEVAEVRYRLIRSIRNKAAADDVRLPEDDAEMLEWMAEGLRESRGE